MTLHWSGHPSPNQSTVAVVFWGSNAMRSSDMAPIRRIPILDVADRLGLKVRGKRAMCFDGHDKRTASLCFAPAKGLWKCFGCGKGGDGPALVMAVLGCDFPNALDWFARQFGVDVSRHDAPQRKRRQRTRSYLGASLPRSRAQPAVQPEFSIDPDLYAWLMSKCGPVSAKQGLAFLNGHGIPREVANEFGVRELRTPERALRRLIQCWGTTRVYRSGLAWGERAMPERLIWTSYSLLFPFLLAGKTVYIQGRMFRGEPKYLNLRGVAKPLYNTDRLRDLEPGAVVHLCEGVPDALALEAQGLPAIGVLGASSFRAEWADLFMRLTVVLLPDGDSGGETFRRTISGVFADRGKAVRVVCLPAGKDVAEVLAEIGETA